MAILFLLKLIRAIPATFGAFVPVADVHAYWAQEGAADAVRRERVLMRAVQEKLLACVDDAVILTPRGHAVFYDGT